MFFSRYSPLGFSPDASRLPRLARVVMGWCLVLALPLGSTFPLTPHPGAAGQFGWPSCHPVAVLKPFNPPPLPWQPGNRGVDLATQSGDPVCAAGGGEVIYAGVLAGKSVVSIRHPSGLRTTYEDVIPNVSVGMRVVRGQPIGSVGSGRGGSLHWGAKWARNDYLNPLLLLDQRIILKSWDG